MARPMWSGSISFGLVNIPVYLYSAELSERSHFHMLDKKNKARIHYERVNDKSGKKVDWQDIIKAYEYKKDHYVLIDEKELKNSDPDFKTIDLKEFIEKKSIEFPYLDKPYYLVPTKQGKKGYLLLMEILEKTEKVGIATVVIKTTQHIAALLPFRNILLLNTIRFEDEVKNTQEFEDQLENSNEPKLSPEEIHMAEQLIKNMTSKWNPKKYTNKSHDLLVKWLDRKIKQKKTITTDENKKQNHKVSNKNKEKVIDFMALLKKSIEEKKKKNKNKNKKNKKAS